MAQPKPSCSKDGPRSLAWHPPRHWYKGDWLCSEAGLHKTNHKHTLQKYTETQQQQRLQSRVFLFLISAHHAFNIFLWIAGFVCGLCLRWMQMDTYVPAARMQRSCNGPCLHSADVSGGCAQLSRTEKLPPQRGNNARERLTEEASGADVFHVDQNAAAAASA